MQLFTKEFSITISIEEIVHQKEYKQQYRCVNNNFYSKV